RHVSEQFRGKFEASQTSGIARGCIGATDLPSMVDTPCPTGIGSPFPLAPVPPGADSDDERRQAEEQERPEGAEEFEVAHPRHGRGSPRRAPARRLTRNQINQMTRPRADPHAPP